MGFMRQRAQKRAARKEQEELEIRRMVKEVAEVTAAQLRQLEVRLESGAISNEEFVREKKRVLETEHKVGDFVFTAKPLNPIDPWK
jgi:hypothetical protein